MSIATLRQEIETIVNALTPPTTYLRKTVAEANESIENFDINQPLAIHTDQTTVTTQLSSGTYLSKTVQTQIWFLLKEINQDPDLTDTDILIDQAEALADQFYDKLVRSSVLDPVMPLESYTLARIEAYKVFDAVLSGVLFTCDVPIPRKDYNC